MVGYLYSTIMAVDAGIMKILESQETEIPS
jgi:hypothetical protein